MSRPASNHREKPNAIEALFGRRKAVIGVIHALPPRGPHAIVADRSPPELTRDVEFSDAGDGVDLGQLETVRRSTSLPVLVGSGVTRDKIDGISRVADTVIAASSLEHEGFWWDRVEPRRVATFMDVVRDQRG